jgi:hypothetical protein
MAHLHAIMGHAWEVSVMHVWAKRLGWVALNRLPDRQKRAVLYFRAFGGRPRLNDPQTFNQKLNWRILNDRRPIIAIMGDKLAMKDHVAERCPEVRIPQTLWAGTDVGELARMDLPKRWVLKPNHSSARVCFGSGPADTQELRRVTAGWLDETLYAERCEWAYSQARRLLFVEEFIGSPDETPTDYKFLIFHGVTRLIQVDYDRFGKHRRRNYDGDWNPFPHDDPLTPLAPVVPRPPTFEAMRAFATRIAGDLDFLRVDLYEAGGEVWFGELTPYPAAGLEGWTPNDLDGELGKYWSLPVLS